MGMPTVEQTPHRIVVTYEYDRDAAHLRRRRETCAADGMDWPCPAETGRRVAEAAVARGRRP